MKLLQWPKCFPARILILIFCSGTVFVSAQEENLNVLSRWIEWSDSENMLIRNLNSRAFALLDERDAEVAGLQTREDWISRQEKVKGILTELAGPFPGKTPLNAKVTGIVKKEGYRIEKILYESLEGFYVTGALYLPDGADPKRPAILFLSGHTEDGFRYQPYQVMILNLVKKGFIVFAIDPLSQGERIQLFDPANNASFIGPTTREHSYLGNQCFISGVSLARYFIWDGIRGIDYLITRKEVDPERLGVTGHSGGGTQAAYIFALDERIKAGAPVNYITGFRRLLESIGPQDAEQNLFHGILNGLTHADLIQVRAPDPALIAAGTLDFFSIQGARETYNEVREAYIAYGKDENIGIVEDDWGHGYTKKLRESVCDFFQRNLNLPGSPDDEEVEVPDPNELVITESGHVASSFEEAETVFTLNKKETQNLVEKIIASRENPEHHLPDIRLKAKELSGYIEPAKEVNPVFRGRYQRDGYSVEMYVLPGEGRTVIPLLLFVPDSHGRSPAVIYLHPGGKIEDSSPGGKIELLVKKGYVVAAADITGIGKVAYNNLNSANFLALLTGRSVTGIQAGDITRVVNFLKTRPDVETGKIGAVAFDEMCTAMLHAATFNRSISSVVLVGSLISYRTVAMNEFYDPQFLNFYVAGALTAYDLPDLIGCIAPGKIALMGLKDQMKRPVTNELRDRELQFPITVFSGINVPGNIYVTNVTEDLNSLVEWSFK